MPRLSRSSPVEELLVMPAVRLAGLESEGEPVSFVAVEPAESIAILERR